MKTTTLLGMSALLGFSLTAAYAQDVPQLSSPEQTTAVPQHRQQDPAAQDPRLDNDPGHENFTDADTDSDGVLSFVEAKLALPHLIVDDGDSDGVLSQAEAEAALPELDFKERGRDGGDAPIGETEFGMIVIALNEREEDTPETFE